MDFKHVTSSTKTYIVLLIIAVAILLFTASMTYRQIKRLQESADRISRTLEIDNTLGDLFSYYARMESEKFRSVILREENPSSSWQDFKLISKSSFDSLQGLLGNSPTQIKQLDSIGTLQDVFYTALTDLDNPMSQRAVIRVSTRNKLKRISETLEKIRTIKDHILMEERRLMIQRREDYAARSFFTPLTSLLMAFFALTVFALSFGRIYVNKKRLRSSESFLRNLLGSTDNIVNYYEPMYDASGNIIDFEIVFANECNKDYLGLSPDAIIGKKASKVFPHLFLNGEFDELIKSFKARERVNFDRQIWVEGKKMWFQSIVNPVSEGIMETSRNSTVEKEAEEKLRVLNQELVDQNLVLKNTEDFLQNILSHTENIISYFEPIRNSEGTITDYKIRYTNEQIEGILGEKSEYIEGKNISEVYPFHFENGVFELLVKCIEDDKIQDFEREYQFGDQKYWFKTTVVPLGGSVLTTSIDVTEQKERLNELHQLNKQLEIQNSILSNAESMAKIGSFTWNPDTDTSEISDNFYRILGYEVTDLAFSSKSYRKFVHPDDIAIYDQRSKMAFSGEASSEETYRIITKNGKVRHMRTNSHFVDNHGNRVMVGVVQDVTRQVKNERKLRKRNHELNQTNAELESFNRVASHDLQEPLRKIQMFLSRIEGEDLNKLPEKSRLYLTKVNNAANRMQSLIRNLLTYSRIDVTHDDFEQVDLNLVLEKTKEDLAVRIKEVNAKITHEKLPIIKGVVFQMEQLFANIITNALKYNNPKVIPEIILKSERVNRNDISENFIKSGEYYQKITIKDNGIGFAAENAEKIFEVFQRLHQRNEYSGTGIGLAICKKIVENHLGFIYATSEMGKGSTFIVYLPA